MNYKKSISLFLFLLSALMLNAQEGRFVERVFSDIRVTTEIPYSEAALVYEDEPETLYFDLYEPEGDTMARRPLVITIFGGAFVAGNRSWCDMVAFADSLSHYGYVVASIDYRLIGIIHINETNFIRGAYAGAQDVSAAIRFFKGNADTYRIDTSQIFLLGNSAGTIAAMHALWMDDDERPAETFFDEGGLFGIGGHSDLGGVHSSGYPEYLSYSPSVAGIIAQWGGVLDTTVIDPDDNTPICLLHGTADETVPFLSGTPYGNSFFGISGLVLPNLFGSYFIDRRLSHFGIDHELRVFEGKEHCFYIEGTSTLLPEELNTCFRIAIDFMAQRNHYIINNIQDLETATIGVFPNPASQEITFTLPNSSDNFQYQLFDATGRVVLAGENQNRLDIAHLQPGIYLLQVIQDGRNYEAKIIKS